MTTKDSLPPVSEAQKRGTKKWFSHKMARVHPPPCPIKTACPQGLKGIGTVRNHQTQLLCNLLYELNGQLIRAQILFIKRQARGISCQSLAILTRKLIDRVEYVKKELANVIVNEIELGNRIRLSKKPKNNQRVVLQLWSGWQITPKEVPANLYNAAPGLIPFSLPCNFSGTN